jgi:N-methylhydantoinase B/oxoprolinase/acetone carboxylase alpha subunit
MNKSFESSVELAFPKYFLYKSKYGGEVHGEIASIFPTHVYDLSKKVVAIRFKMRSTKGITYELGKDEIVFYSERISDERAEHLIKMMEGMHDRKQAWKAKMDIRFEEICQT